MKILVRRSRSVGFHQAFKAIVAKITNSRHLAVRIEMPLKSGAELPAKYADPDGLIARCAWGYSLRRGPPRRMICEVWGFPWVEKMQWPIEVRIFVRHGRRFL